MRRTLIVKVNTIPFLNLTLFYLNLSMHLSQSFIDTSKSYNMLLLDLLLQYFNNITSRNNRITAMAV
ncbi:553_t:CDS:1, partial [Racocetra persica]